MMRKHRLGSNSEESCYEVPGVSVCMEAELQTIYSRNRPGGCEH
jgi:hypothetical protein